MFVPGIMVQIPKSYSNDRLECDDEIASFITAVQAKVKKHLFCLYSRSKPRLYLPF